MGFFGFCFCFCLEQHKLILAVLEVRNHTWVSLGYNQDVSRGSSKGNYVSCSFQLLGITYIPWLVALFSIFRVNNIMDLEPFFHCDISF